MWNRNRHSFRIVGGQEESHVDDSKSHPIPDTPDRESVRLESVSLREFINQICRGHAAEFLRNQIRLELDVPYGMTLQADPSWLQVALDLLIEKSVDRMADGGDLYITAVASDRFMELEFCDSSDRVLSEARPDTSVQTEGPSDAQAEYQALLRILRMHEGTVKQMKCPQGGLAWNMRFPRRYQQRAAA